MSDNGHPDLPPGVDPLTGATLLNTVAFYILDKALTLDPKEQPSIEQAWELGFTPNPVPPFRPTQGPLQLPWAVFATWGYASMAIGLQQQQIHELGAQLQATQNALAQTHALLTSLAAYVQENAENFSGDLEAMQRDLDELGDSIIIVPKKDEPEDPPIN